MFFWNSLAMPSHFRALYYCPFITAHTSGPKKLNSWELCWHFQTSAWQVQFSVLFYICQCWLSASVPIKPLLSLQWLRLNFRTPGVHVFVSFHYRSSMAVLNKFEISVARPNLLARENISTSFATLPNATKYPDQLTIRKWISSKDMKFLLYTYKL